MGTAGSYERRRKLEDCTVETRRREKPQITEMFNKFRYVA